MLLEFGELWDLVLVAGSWWRDKVLLIRGLLPASQPARLHVCLRDRIYCAFTSTEYHSHRRDCPRLLGGGLSSACWFSFSQRSGNGPDSYERISLNLADHFRSSDANEDSNRVCISTLDL